MALQAQLLHRQRTVGNQAVQRLIRSGLVAQPTARAESAGRASRITALEGRTADTPHVQPAWYNFDIPFTNYQFDPSLEGIKTAATVVKDTAVAAIEWIVDEIKSVVSSGIDWLSDKWESIQEFASSAYEAAKNSFSSIVSFIKNPLGFLANALMSFDAQALAKAWATFSGLITKAANGFKAMTDTLLQQVNKAWSGINGFATSLLNRVASLTDSFIFKKLPDALQRVAFTVVNGLKSLWKSINDGWIRLFNKIKAWVDGAIDAVLGFVRKVLSFGINVVIAGIVQFGQLVLFLKDLFANPMKYVALLAKRSVQAFDGVESRFAGVVGQHFGSAKTAAPATAATTTIHRSPQPGASAETKGSATWGEVGHGVADMMGKKWAEFKANPMAVVVGLLVDMIFPIVGNIKDVVQLFKDIKKIVTGPLSAGSLEELWTSLLQILDIPILIYHTVVSILMRSLMVPLIVATFIPHPLVKGIAAAVGYALLAGFVESEGLNLAHKLLLLKTGATTKAQKEEAYNRIADSLIALAMTAVIMLIMLILHFIANVMKGVYNFVKGKVFGVEAAPVEGKGTAPGEGKGSSADDPASSRADPESGRLLETGHKEGVSADKATPQQAAEGSIKMAEDARYPAALKQISDAGFELRITTEGSPRVVVKEVYGPDGNLLRTEKYILAREGMRFLDLEHEIGHMQQLTERFADRPPATERVIETPDGKQKPAKDLSGTLTNWQNAIVEFHNRLVEWLRLRQNGASPELLREHARGVAEWRELYLDKGLKGGRSPSQKAWANEHFPDIADLVRQYEAAGGRAME